MSDKPKKLSDTARALLTLAATRDDHLIRPPNLPTAAARQVARSLLNAGLAEEVTAPIEDVGYAWHTGEDAGVLMLRATMLGLVRIGQGDGYTPAMTSAPLVDTSNSADADGATPAVAPGVDHLPAAVSPLAPAIQGESAAGTAGMPGSVVSKPADSAQASSKARGPAACWTSLREPAQAVLEAWDELPDTDRAVVAAMSGALDGLRAALAHVN